MSSLYTREIIDIFIQHADPDQAVAMSKYMKNKFDFYGIKAPIRRDITKPFLGKSRLPNITDAPEIALELWLQPQRELQYFACELLRKYSGNAPREWFDLYEKLILAKSWWDTVDGLAAWHVGDLFAKYPEEIQSRTDAWMRSGNIWLQRKCLLFQLMYKERTDFELLKSFVTQLAESREFFIRKAIGWSLRQYARVKPKEVLEFLDKQPLSSLSYREAKRSISN